MEEKFDFNNLKTLFNSSIDLKDEEEIEVLDVTEEIESVGGKQTKEELENQEEEIIEDPEVEVEEDNNEEGNEVDTVKTIFNHFEEKGIFSIDEELKNKGTWDEEDIEKVINSEVDKRAKSKLSTYENEKTKAFIDFLEQGGSPNQYLQIHSEPDLSEFTEEDIKDRIDDQKAIVEMYLRKRNFTDEEIQDTISTYEETGVLETKAGANLIKLQELQAKDKETKTKEALEEVKKRREEAVKTKASIIKEIDSTTELMGIKFNSDFKAKFKDFIFEVEKTGIDKVKEEVKKEENYMKLALLAYVGFDLNKLTQSTESKVKKSLKDKLNNSSSPSFKPNLTKDDKTKQEITSTLKKLFN